MIAFKSFFAIFVIAICITSVFNMEIRCNFVYVNFYITSSWESKYTCEISTPIENLDIEDFISGTHLTGKSNDNVEGVRFLSLHETSYFAAFSKLQRVFPNIRYLRFSNSNLNGISVEHLKPLSNLYGIEIFMWQISSLFKLNRNLRILTIEDNKKLNSIETRLVQRPFKSSIS